jgi:AraC-like DNA-binding protein
MGDVARERYERIRRSSGCRRLSHFIEYLSELAKCNDYRLLSTAQLQSQKDDMSMSKISGIVTYLTENLESDISMAQVCAGLGMTESQFSRFFRRGTGNTFTDFVNRLRIHKACLLLMDTDRHITRVCFDVGFNNIANFNRRFLQFKGMTPREFRRQASKRFGRSAGVVAR